jgi:hypothetical protein
MLSGFNYKGTAKFAFKFEQMSKGFDSWLRSFLYKRGKEFIEEVSYRTPVDTGLLEASWELKEMVKEGRTLKLYFENTAYYADWVEYGHAKPYKSGAQPGSIDWVDGFFMMTTTLDEIYREMPAKFEVEFKSYLRKFGIK